MAITRHRTRSMFDRYNIVRDAVANDRLRLEAAGGPSVIPLHPHETV